MVVLNARYYVNFLYQKAFYDMPNFQQIPLPPFFFLQISCFRHYPKSSFAGLIPGDPGSMGAYEETEVWQVGLLILSRKIERCIHCILCAKISQSECLLCVGKYFQICVDF